MHYSSGNYEAFVRPRKPEGADNKTAWFVGSGLAGLAGAAFLIRDAGVTGEKISILEELEIPGGALDGLKVPEKGFVIRGGREMEEHFECLWDLYRSIPSLEIEHASVLDEFYRLNTDDPNYSLQRVTQNCGQDVPDKALLTLSGRAQKDLLSVFLAAREELENKRINEVFGEDFLKSNFWLYWRTMFAFEEWHSALEMKLYLHRFIHHIGSLADFSSLKFNRYNQYESMVLPLVKWLKDRGVNFRYGVEVIGVDFDIQPGRKQATHIHWVEKGVAGGIDLGPDDLVFITIGSLTENSDSGDHHTPAMIKDGPAPAWDLWRRIAAKDGAFGRPDVFGAHIPETKWESATITTLDERIPRYIQKVAKRDPFSGKVVTGGIVTVKDSSWLLSWTVSRQPHFKQQPKNQIVAWFYALFVDKPGDYVKKPMQDCTGEEITQEWLYHLGVPVDEILQLAATGARTVPVMMPYITAFFMPRQAGDRPDVVPEGAVNFAFIGQFAESKERDCIFTTEYSVRTPMEAVYTLLDVERGVPEVFNSTYDIRKLLSVIAPLRDGKGLDVPGPAFLRKLLLKKIEGTEIGEIFEKFHLFFD
ncbi:Oleate hydratase [Methylobacterium brachiatum]|jgi:oleate hydratase|nr:Oleate hydratase [Methylobacterium brachiatum]